MRISPSRRSTSDLQVSAGKDKVMRCDEAASLKLTGKIKRKKGKATGPGKTFTIHALSAAARANVPVAFTVKVPGAALDSLKAGAKESASFTLTGKNPSGSATATAKIGRLTL